MRRDPGEARLLGLWTAGCLAVLLLAGLLWVGDLSLQWPVFALPLVWALVAARHRRPAGRPVVPPTGRPVVPPTAHTAEDDPYPATREAPTLPPPPGRWRPRDR